MTLPSNNLKGLWLFKRIWYYLQQYSRFDKDYKNHRCSFYESITFWTSAVKKRVYYGWIISCFILTSIRLIVSRIDLHLLDYHFPICYFSLWPRIFVTSPAHTGVKGCSNHCIFYFLPQTRNGLRSATHFSSQRYRMGEGPAASSSRAERDIRAVLIHAVGAAHPSDGAHWLCTGRFIPVTLHACGALISHWLNNFWIHFSWLCSVSMR